MGSTTHVSPAPPKGLLLRAVGRESCSWSTTDHGPCTALRPESRTCPPWKWRDRAQAAKRRPALVLYRLPPLDRRTLRLRLLGRWDQPAETNPNQKSARCTPARWRCHAVRVKHPCTHCHTECRVSASRARLVDSDAPLHVQSLPASPCPCPELAEHDSSSSWRATHARTVARIAPSFTEISAKTMCLNPDGRGRERSVSGQDRIGRVGGITPGQRHPLHQPSNGEPSPSPSLPSLFHERCALVRFTCRKRRDLPPDQPPRRNRPCVCVCVCVAHGR